MRLLVEGESDEGVVVVISEGAARVASEVAAVVAGVMALAGGVASVNDAIDVEVARARQSMHGGCRQSSRVPVWWRCARTHLG
jgi:hypothetical protein